MWIPSWLGETYSRLYSRFKGELFTFREAMDHLGFNENKQAVAFSRLHSHRLLLVFEAGRPRRYRILDPQGFILLASDVLRNLDEIAQERYVKLLCAAYRLLSEAYDLSSLAVYGTVARGTAEENSDVDLLVISNDFTGSLGSRIQGLCRVEERLSEELAWLRRHDVYTGLSFYPLREEEAGRAPLLFLDLTEDAVILYDRDRFLEGVLASLRAKLLRLGAKRVILDKERWYWDLKPGYRFGEEIPL